MQILPVTTPTLKKGDSLPEIFSGVIDFCEGDILVVSSKAIATVEGATIDLSTLIPTKEAQELSEKYNGSPEMNQAMLDELVRLNGRIVHATHLATFTEVRPGGMQGAILIAWAGLDQSNTPTDTAVGWPMDPVSSGRDLRQSIEERTGKRIAVIVTDSCLMPRRRGVSALALSVSGFDPIRSEKGKADIFGKPLRVTEEATADQIAIAANAIMGNASQSTPAAIIRDHNIPFSDFEGWVPGIAVEDDIFGNVFTKAHE